MSQVTEPKKHEFKAEMKQLLHLIVHSLYTHPEVFLRELISNASDAMNKLKLAQAGGETVRDADLKLEIRIEADKDKGTFSISDAGIGMTEEDLIRHLGTIAKSGTLDYLQRAKESGQSGADLIGQFGVGFYSVYMVTKTVEVETLSADPAAQAYKWVSDGESDFKIEVIEKKSRGTTISFKVNEDRKEFSDPEQLRKIVRNYSNYADFPVFVNGEQANKVEAIWRKSASSVKPEEYNEFYKSVSNDFSDPARKIHLDIEGAAVSFKALLYIPQKAPFDIFRTYQDKGPDLYCNKVLIRHDFKELLPDYLRFITGVVDTSELPLNVSRELTQSSPVTLKIKDILVKKILTSLEEWAGEEGGTYQDFFNEFGPMLKAGIESDFAFKDRLVELLRFETTLTEEKRSKGLRQIVESLKPEQSGVYYLAGDDVSSLRNSPKLEYFRKNGQEVILLTDPSDLFCMNILREYDGKKFVSVDEADIDLQTKDQIDRAENEMDKSLIEEFKNILKEKVKDVRFSKRLVDSAATLVRAEGSLDAATEKMMRMMGQSFPESPRVLEINYEHPVIRKMARATLAESEKAKLPDYVRLVFDSARLADGTLSPSESQDCSKRILKLLQDLSA